MGSHLGTRPTRNSKAIVPVNLFDKEVIRGKVAQDTNRGDILFSTEYGFNETLDSIVTSPTSYGLQISVEKHNGSYYMVVGQASSPCIITYRLVDGLWVTQKPPTQRVISSAYGVSLKSYNGKLYLAVAHYTAPFVTIFYWAGDEWHAIGDFADTPGSNARSASLTVFNNKLYLAVAHVSAPFITTYVKSTVDESWTKLAQPTVLPVSTGKGAKNLLNLTTWTLGTGSVTDFGANGTVDENSRIIDTNPFGIPAVVWQGVKNNDGINGGDGGWNSSFFDVDTTKIYRFSTWVRRKDIQADGRFYLGIRSASGSNTSFAVLRKTTHQLSLQTFISHLPDFQTGIWQLLVLENGS